VGFCEAGDPVDGGGEEDSVSVVGGDDSQAGGQMGFAGAGRDRDRLQQLRAVLPCEVRVTSMLHPLFGRLLGATGFKRWRGRLLLVVVLPDGSPGTIAADATDVLGEPRAEGSAGVFTVEGLRELKAVVEVLGAGVRSPSRRRARK
jgi:hypothetical protein